MKRRISQPNFALLFAVVFSTGILGAVHLCAFVWLTAFVYGDNIRGYVPAGLTGLLILLMATILTAVYLQFLATRKNHPVGRYILGVLFGAPMAIILTSLYGNILLTLTGYSLPKDIAVHSLGIIIFAAIAVRTQMYYFRKSADNMRLQEDSRSGSP